MTAYNGTVVQAGRPGRAGMVSIATGYYALTGGITGHATTGDTITFTDFFRKGPGGFYVRKVKILAPELDTHSTPTGRLIAGNSDDDNGFITTAQVAVTIPDTLGPDLVIESRAGVGDLLDTVITNRDLIIEFTAALETSATSGTISVEVWVEGVNA